MSPINGITNNDAFHAKFPNQVVKSEDAVHTLTLPRSALTLFREEPSLRCSRHSLKFATAAMAALELNSGFVERSTAHH